MASAQRTGALTSYHNQSVIVDLCIWNLAAIPLFNYLSSIMEPLNFHHDAKKMALLPVLLSFGLQFFLLQNVSATCYWPDGNATSTDYAPCNYGTTSMCCDTANNDICTPEGLCLYHKTSYTRDACTDSTWASPNCVSVCMCTLKKGSVKCYKSLG